METQITQGIKVSVEVSYQFEHSSPADAKYIHAYRVSIENLSPRTVQLISRHWIIKDADACIREVEGEGVIGQQPVLEPGETHEYVSFCHLYTPIGQMHGSYTMRALHSGETFKVDVPMFKMVAPVVLN